MHVTEMDCISHFLGGVARWGLRGPYSEGKRETLVLDALNLRPAGKRFSCFLEIYQQDLLYREGLHTYFDRADSQAMMKLLGYVIQQKLLTLVARI